MTDEEYFQLLNALAAKYLAAKGHRRDPHYLWHENERLRADLESASEAARLLKVVQDRPDDTYLLNALRERLTKTSPIERAKTALEETGLLESLEEAGSVVFKQLRRRSIPLEDTRFLRDAGYTDDEIEILFALAIDKAHHLSGEGLAASLSEAAHSLEKSLERLERLPRPESVVPPKKRKLFNGLGKILGGSIAGIGNALMATGTILAPNPATAAGSIASAAVAIPAILAGVGDLRGE